MAGRIRDEDIAAVRERSPIDEVVGEYLQLRNAGGGSLKGLCPFHDEKTPSFNVTPARGLFYCFSCAEGGDAIKFVQKIDGLSLRRGGRAAGRAGGHRSPLRAGRLRPGPGTEPAAQADRRAPGGRRFLCRTTGRFRRRAGPRLPGRTRLRARRRPAVRRRLLAEGLGRPDQAPARPGLHRQRADHGGPVQGGQPRHQGPVPRAADVAHPRPVRRRHRVRRAQARPRGRRAQVPEHAGDLAVPQEHRAVRGGPGQARDRAAQAGGHRRGLHRRDGLPPGRGADRGGHLRHLVRRGPHQGAAPADHGHRRVRPAR